MATESFRKKIREALCDLAIGISAVTVIVAPWMILLDAVKGGSAESNKKTAVNQAVHLDNLIINTTDGFFAIVNKDEIQGIKDLQGLLDSSVHEEAWVYLPKKQAWIEVGYNEIITDRSISTTIDTNKLKEIWDKDSEIIMYHMHPYLQAGQEKTMIYAYTAIPSHADLESMIKTSQRFYLDNSKGSITHKIASKYGITEYRLTDRGRELVNARAVDFITDYTKKALSRIAQAKSSLNLSDIPYLEIIFTPYSLIK